MDGSGRRQSCYAISSKALIHCCPPPPVDCTALRIFLASKIDVAIVEVSPSSIFRKMIGNFLETGGGVENPLQIRLLLLLQRMWVDGCYSVTPCPPPQVGIGGRLDATNCVTPVVCGITSLGMDHMEMLGDTLPVRYASVMLNGCPDAFPDRY